jgi:hypothetical protein
VDSLAGGNGQLWIRIRTVGQTRLSVSMGPARERRNNQNDRLGDLRDRQECLSYKNLAALKLTRYIRAFAGFLMPS